MTGAGGEARAARPQLDLATTFSASMMACAAYSTDMDHGRFSAGAGLDGVSACGKPPPDGHRKVH